MGQTQFQALFIISLLFISIHLPQGHGRRVKIMRTQEKASWAGRTMVEMVDDYKEPGANTNPRSGDPFDPHMPPRP